MSDSFVTPRTVACQAPLSMEFPRQEYWRGLPFPSPGHLPNPGIKLNISCLAGGFFTTEPPVSESYHKNYMVPCILRASQVTRWLRIHLQYRRHRFYLWIGKIPWRRKWQTSPVFLPWKPGQEDPGGLIVHGVTKSQT